MEWPGFPASPLRALRALPRVLPHLDEVPTMRSVPGVRRIAGASRTVARRRPRTHDGGVLEGRELQAPPSPINRRITPHRRVAFSRQSLDEVKRIKDHFGVTVNDVVVTICAGALRSWLTERGELPPEPMVAMVPVSVRTAEQAGTFGNRVSAMLVPIPTDEPDPGERLRKAHESLRSAKDHHQAVPAAVMQDANHMVPPALLVRAARMTTMVNAREAPVNTVISNVPGPASPLFLAGARIEAITPVSGIMDGIGLNLTVLSYCGELNFGVVVDRDAVDDPIRAERLASAMLAPGACGRESRPRALLNQPPLELRQRGKNMEDEFAGRGRRIQRAIAQRAEAHLPLAQLRNHCHQMEHRPPQTIQPPDHKGVARCKACKQASRPGGGVRPRSDIQENLLVGTPRLAQGLELQTEVLLRRADAGIADGPSHPVLLSLSRPVS